MKNVDNLKFYLQKLIFEEINSFDAPDLQPKIDPKKWAIAGGAIRAYLAGEEIKDFDIFTQDKETEDQLKNAILTLGGEILRENDLLADFKFKNRWFQIIKGRHYDISNSSLIDSFDFTICGAMVRADGGFDSVPTFFQDVLAKHLRVIKITFPLASLQRMQRYIQRGYTACNGTLLEMTKSLATVNLNDPQTNSLAFYPDGTPRFIGID